MEIVELKLSQLKPYDKNARKHEDYDISAIMASIETFGFRDPIGVWSEDNIIVEGHGRYEAAKRLKLKTVPCIRLDELTDEQRRAYALAHNKTAELSSWLDGTLFDELDNIFNIDMGKFGFDMSLEMPTTNSDDVEYERKKAEFEERMAAGEIDDDDEEYQAFIEKFAPKKTTDDCYTPELVYNAVRDWVANEYKVKYVDFVRPFYPGGDYKTFTYKPADIVVDNPPFSILSEIIEFYAQKKIKYFLFAPTLTLFSSSSSSSSSCLPLGVTVTYENGANVNTSFVTNLEDTNVRVRSVPRLYQAIDEANKRNLAAQHKELPKYYYNDYIVTATRVAQFSQRGVEFVVPRDESVHIRQLDAQKASGKAIFGSAFLISERIKAEKEKAEKEKAEKEKAEKEKAEKEKAEKWELSDREMKIVKSLEK